MRRGLLTVDESGLVTGSLGLTVEPTEYRVRLGQRSLYAWCALDAVGIPAALRADAIVEWKGGLRVEIKSGRIASARPRNVAISLPDPRLDVSIRKEICPTITFRIDEKEPDHPGVAFLTLDEAADLGRKTWAPAEAPSSNETSVVGDDAA